jgi:hypothetical protein
MKVLERRVRRLEGRCGTTRPLPWETPGGEQLSDAEQLLEAERYVAAYPDSRLARTVRAIEALSDRELEALLAEANQVTGSSL